MNSEYGIATPSAKVKHTGFTREEALAYIDCEGQHGEFIIRKSTAGEWYSTSTGHTLEEIQEALKLEN